MLPVAQAQPGERQVILRPGALRIALDGRLVRAQSLGHPAHIQKGVAAVGGSGPVAQRLGPFKYFYGLGKAAIVVEQDAVHIHGLSVVRLARQSPAQPLPCAGLVALGGAELAPGNVCLHLGRVQREGLAQVSLGLGRTAAFALQQGQVDPARNQIRPQLDGPPQRRFGISFAPLIAQQAAEIHPGRCKIRPPHERPAITHFGLMQPF